LWKAAGKEEAQGGPSGSSALILDKDYEEDLQTSRKCDVLYVQRAITIANQLS